MTTTTTVRPGQVWQDNDKRSYGRQVRVVGTDATHATVELHIPRGAGHLHAKPGRRTRIRLDRFKPTPTGYLLVQDQAGAAIHRDSAGGWTAECCAEELL